MKWPINIFKNMNRGEDIYIVGSGPSLKFIDSDFFLGKYVIGINYAYKVLPCEFVLIKHGFLGQEIINAGHRLIASEYESANNTLQKNEYEGTYFYFTHKTRGDETDDENFKANIEAIGKDEDIFVSRSAITSGMHLAAYMGAKNIILIGHDCGVLDGLFHSDGKENKSPEETQEQFEVRYKDWLGKTNNESIVLKKKLLEVYKCNIYSLNPFINFRLEGHKYDT